MGKGKGKRKVEDMEKPLPGSAQHQSLYEILEVEKTASQAEIKKAYHKLALRLHPDKNPESKDAKEKFQALQNVMSILGDPEKRAVYDETGIVEHAELAGENGASLAEYVRSLYKKITEEDIEAFADSYRGSEEETKDLKELYTRCEGNMKHVFHMHMCSDPALDSHRFMEVINDAIAAGEVKEMPAYRKWAKAVAKKPAPADPLARPKKKNGKNDVSTDLMAAIQLRGKDRMDSLFSKLERKYATSNEPEDEEPNEEEFQAARQRLGERGQRRKSRKK